MKSILGTALAFFAILLLTSTQAAASGMGGYLSVGTGTAKINLEPDVGADSSGSGNATPAGFGFVFDTNCATPELLNYRLNAGYEATAINPDNSNRSESFQALVLDNALGFGIMANQAVRVWAGPTARVGYLMGTGSGFTKEAGSAIFGLGAVVGVNYHLGLDHDLSMAFGVRSDWYNGNFRYNSSYKGAFDGSSTYAFFTVALLWRGLDDKFPL